jgi:type IV secretory pathway TrbL component
MPKSKESRQKLRRWTFAVEMKLEGGQTHAYKVPGVVFGNAAEAKAVAAELTKNYAKEDMAPAGLEIIPVSHETVSADTKRQLEGLNENSNLAFKAAYILAHRVKIAAGLEQTEHDLVQDAVELARKQLNKRLAEAPEELVAEADAAVPTQANTAEVSTETPKPKRKIGIDALNEILNGPVE